MSKGLTSFRALAFFGIFFLHLKYFGSGQFGIEGGYLGVQAFFVLSGFLLTPILVDMKSNLNMRDFFIHFYGRRSLRIFPLYYLYIALVASVYFLVKSQYGHLIPINGSSIITDTHKYVLTENWHRFIENLPWTMTYTYDFHSAINNYKASLFDIHFWSLAVEEQFYLVWPLAIFFIPANHLKRFLLLVIMAGPLMRFALAMIVDGNMLPLLNHQKNLVIFCLPFSYVDAFAIGGFFALYEKSRSSYLTWLSILLVLMLGMITSWLSTGQIHWDQLGYGGHMMDSYKYVWGYSVVSLVFSFVLVQIRDKKFMPLLFENSLLVYLGTISYGMYVFHLLILSLVYSTMNSFPEFVRATAALLITAMISMVSYELMEKRFINLKDKYFAKASTESLTIPPTPT